MKELLAAFLASLSELKTKANVMLAGLPPIEQYEATSDIASGLRCLRVYGNDLLSMAQNLEGKMNGFVTQAETLLTAEAQKNAETVLLAAGEFIKKVDAQAAQALALQEMEKTMRDTFTAERQKETKIAEKRAKLVSDKVLPLVVAEQISGEVLAADDADIKVTKVSERMKKLDGLGLTAEGAPLVYAELGALAPDDAGDALFNTRFASIEQATAKKQPAVVAKQRVVPGAGGGSAATGFTAEELV